MINTIGKLLVAILLLMCLPAVAQPPAFEELAFEADSTGSAYKAAGKNYVLVRSKRGNSGVNKTPEADAILSAEVTEIVLVFTETDPSAIAEREDANRERWENLLMTYPEFFQFSTTYKNVCQCSSGGDADALKKVQGFYIYVNGEVPRPATPVAAAPPSPSKTEVPPSQPAATPPATKTEEKKPAEKEIVSTTPVKTETPPPAPAKTPEPPAHAESNTHHDEEVAHHDEHAGEKTAVKKRSGAATSKGRKAKNPKACRPACYEGGDEDLYAFFKNNMPLTKKERRKSKNLVAAVKIQLDVDGAIKKTQVTGESEKFNKHVEDVIKSMSPWNCAVKNGMAVRSEVKFIVKFDKESKSMKPFDILVTPKPGPKCKCASDAEIFGTN